MTTLYFLGSSQQQITDIIAALDSSISVITPVKDQDVAQVQNLVVDTSLNPANYFAIAELAALQEINLYVIISDINAVAKLLPILPYTKFLFGNVSQICYLAKGATGEIPLLSDRSEIVDALTSLWDQGVKFIFASDGANGVYVRPGFGAYVHYDAFSKIITLDPQQEVHSFAAAAIAKIATNATIDDAVKQALAAVALLGYSGIEITPHSINKVLTDAQEDAVQCSAPQFEPIVPVSSNLSLADLTLSRDQLRAFLRYKRFPADKPSDAITQLSTKGLALAVSDYKSRKKYDCQMVVASISTDITKMARIMHTAMNGEKVVVIFQATDGMKAESFECNLHRNVIFFEKRDDALHVMYADGIAFPAIAKYVYSLVEQGLPDNSSFVFYKQQMLPHPIPENKFLFLQVNFTACGTIALRMADKIASAGNFIDTLVLGPAENCVSARGITSTVFSYEIPPCFAVNASSSLTKSALLNLFEGRTQIREELSAKFAKHEKEPYVDHFSLKHLAQIEKLFATEDKAVLKKKIEAADARNFRLRYI